LDRFRLQDPRKTLYPFTVEVDNPWTEQGTDDSGESVSPISFRVDTHSGIPIYLQLVNQVDHALRLGQLREGDQLPRIRDVVGSLSINPNTVAKAYRELERAGYAVGRPGLGTFIVATPRVMSAEKLSAFRRSLVRGWLSDAIAAGLDQEAITAVFAAALRDSARAIGSAKPQGTRQRNCGEADVG
jgi:GntR family transcriptional regulator